MRVCVWECDTTHSDMWQDSNISRSASEASPPRTSLYILYSIEARCQRATPHCNTLQHPATPCNTLQHPATKQCARKASSSLNESLDLRVWHDPFRCVTWPIRMSDMTHSDMWHDPFGCVTWPIHMCDMTHSDVWHDPFRCVTWPVQMCDMTHSDVWHDPFRCVTRLIHMCDMTPQYRKWSRNLIPRRLHHRM